MSERKLARVVKLDDVIVHPNADALDLAIVGGWQCVVKRGEFQKGDLAIYIEVDAAVPLDKEPFAFLLGKNNVTIDGERYARIKTIKLRKELSQGLVIPLVQWSVDATAEEGDDVSESLGIVKYEAQAAREANGQAGAVGSKAFPSFIHKTDQERVQNLVRRYDDAVANGELFEKSFKLDGSSMTVWHKDGKVGVCSRNVGFNVEDESRGLWATLKRFLAHVKQRGWANAKWEPYVPMDDNAFTRIALEHNLPDLMIEYKHNVALQGELVGPSIQKNFEGVEENQFYVYQVFDIDTQEYLLPGEARQVVADLNELYVPLASESTLLPSTVADAILDADGPSGLFGKYREGFVYKSLTRDFSFKVISNAYLLKEE